MNAAHIQLSDNDNSYIDLILEILYAKLSKSVTASQIQSVVTTYQKIPINGLIRDIITDLECHLDIYSSDTNDYRLLQHTFTFSDGIDQYIEVLNSIKHHSNVELPNNIYKIYPRWIYWNNQKIEVMLLYEDHWDFQIFKEVNNDQYYLSVLFNASAVYWEKVTKVDEKDISKLKMSIHSNNVNEINFIVDSIKKQLYH